MRRLPILEYYVAPPVSTSHPITHTSPTSWFRRNIGVRALLTIDRADPCGLSTAERTGSPVLHILWSYVLVSIAREFLAGYFWSRDPRVSLGECAIEGWAITQHRAVSRNPNLLKSFQSSGMLQRLVDYWLSFSNSKTPAILASAHSHKQILP